MKYKFNPRGNIVQKLTQYEIAWFKKKHGY
ncbi:LsbB family leaderless bacteriocin, partial [Enterococcus lactis]|nr:LsbB family leaderless bacteriocin [Enterococcus lactis]